MSHPGGQIIHNFNELFESGVEEAFQQSIFDFFPDIICVYDTDQRKLRYVNKKISTVLGFTSDDLIEWNYDLLKIVYEEDVDLVLTELGRYAGLADEVTHSFQCRFNRKTEDWLTVKVTGKVIKRNAIGMPSSLLFVAQDISSYIKATQELSAINAQIREREELMSDYKEQIDVKEEFLECGSWKITFADKIMTWSDGMYLLFGYNLQNDRQAIVVNEALYHSHMLEADFSKAVQFRNQIKSVENKYADEYEITTRNGEKKRIETFARIIRGSDGMPERMLGTSHNITQIRNFDEEREKNISQLKDSVSNLEEFTQIASHDIQEPLRRIATFSENMKAKFAADLNGEAMGYLDRIMKTSKNAHLLIDGLMDFLQLDHKHQHFVTADMNTLLSEVKDELELRLEESQATIISETLPRLEVIPQQIKQLLVNLISNALKFRKPEIPLVVAFDARKLTQADIENRQLSLRFDYFEITVKDNGVGFKAGAAEKMFQMFQRFHNKSSYPGAGIGLAICKKIADKHRGLITARSVVGEGAAFSIVLPVKQMKDNDTR
jgi:PAS domain S-box-containing protein